MAETTPTNPQAPAPDNRPRLRCPACQFMVPLPAETCPKCQANLRTGFIPVSEEDESSGRRRWRVIMGGLVLVMVAAVAALFFFVLPPKAAVGPAPQTGTGTGLSDALETFHDLPNQPLGTQPAIILDKTRDTANQAEERWDQVDEIYQDK